jgi:hypothetical protein
LVAERAPYAQGRSREQALAELTLKGLRALRDRVERESPQAHCVNCRWSEPIEPSPISLPP